MARFDYQLVDLRSFLINHLLILILMKLSVSKDVSKIFHGYVEEWNWKLLEFKTLLSLNCLHTKALKFYSLLLSLVEFTIQYGNYKEIPSWKENYGEFTYVIRHLTNYPWWIRQLSSGSIILHLWFELILAVGHFVNSWRLWFVCGTFIDEQSASKTEKKINTGNVIPKKRGSVAKPTCVKKEKDIPGLLET